MGGKKVGIFVNTDKHLEHILGICSAAVAKDIRVSIFVMDDGVFLTRNPRFLELVKKGVEISLCDHVYREKGLEGRVEGIVHGSQYENAAMAHESDRLLVL